MMTPDKNKKSIYYYESLHTSNDDKCQSNKPNINIKLGIHIISRNNKKQIKIPETQLDNKIPRKLRLKLKHKLTPFQKITKQKKEIKILNNLKILQNKNLFHGNNALITNKLIKISKVDNHKENTYNSYNSARCSPKEYFNKITNYKSNVSKYNSLKPDLYHYILNFDNRNQKFLENKLEIDDNMTITAQKRKFVTKFYSQLNEELQTTDSGLLNIKEQMRYKNLYSFNKTKENFKRNNLLILNKKKFENDINNILFSEKNKENNESRINKSRSNLKLFVTNFYKNKKNLCPGRNNNNYKFNTIKNQKIEINDSSGNHIEKNNIANFFISEKTVLSE